MVSEVAQHEGEAQSSARKIGEKLLKSNSLIFTYLRSIVSSQAASWLDLGLGITLFTVFHVDPLISTAIGAICGGILNCTINYRFTFRAEGCDWRAVVLKYAMVWTGSMLLNTYGTDAFYNYVSTWTWLQDIGFKPGGIYTASRLFASLMVSWFWNFALQRYFVYRHRGIDKYLVNILAFFGIGKKNNVI